MVMGMEDGLEKELLDGMVALVGKIDRLDQIYPYLRDIAQQAKQDSSLSDAPANNSRYIAALEEVRFAPVLNRVQLLEREVDLSVLYTKYKNKFPEPNAFSVEGSFARLKPRFEDCLRRHSNFMNWGLRAAS